MIDFIRKGKNTSDATATANDIINPKTAYVDNEKITGAMLDNGQLNYNVPTSEQLIPSGYTSGGTIQASKQTNEEYDNCLELSNFIIYGENIVDIPNSGYSKYVVFIYYNRVYCMEHNSSPVIGFASSAENNDVAFYNMYGQNFYLFDNGIYERSTDIPITINGSTIIFNKEGNFTPIYSNIDLLYDNYWQNKLNKEIYFKKTLV